MPVSTQFNVILKGPKQNEVTLSYTLIQSESAQIWFKCLQATLQSRPQTNKSAIGRFYNFPGQANSLKELTQELQTCMQELKSVLPEIEAYQLNSASDESLQKSLNRLHTQFAHNHLVENSITNENRQLWSHFNTLIHKIESALVNSKVTKSTPALSIARIEVAWESPTKIEIPEICFADYSLKKEFGSVQINYCQVGRHLLELYSADDKNVPLEHIHPARWFSANATLWFGPTLNEEYEKNQLAKIKKWFDVQEKKFNAAGVFWEQPARALGFVTVATLNHNFTDDTQKRHLQEMLALCNEIHIAIPGAT